MTKRRATRKSKSAPSFSSYWRKLKRIGWLNDLADEEMVEIRVTLKKGFESDTDPIFAFLALSRFAFDSEGFSFERRYIDTIKIFAENSNRAFTPTRIQETCKDSKKRVAFTHNGKRYACVIDILDWFDDAILDLINQAMEDTGVEKRFITLPAADQIASFVCVPPKIYEKAISTGLIPTQRNLDEFIGWTEEF
jgi:hypothetical protein